MCWLGTAGAFQFPQESGAIPFYQSLGDGGVQVRSGAGLGHRHPPSQLSAGSSRIAEKEYCGKRAAGTSAALELVAPGRRCRGRLTWFLTSRALWCFALPALGAPRPGGPLRSWSPVLLDSSSTAGLMRMSVLCASAGVASVSLMRGSRVA